MKRKFKDAQKPFKWKHFSGEMMLWSVHWYCRYVLSYADIQEKAIERGLEVERSALYRWVQEFRPELT